VCAALLVKDLSCFLSLFFQQVVLYFGLFVYSLPLSYCLYFSIVIAVVFNTTFTLCSFETKGEVFLILDQFLYFSPVK